MQYHQGQVTVERLVAQLQAIGVSISKRQLMRLLIDRQDDFLTETREVLRAGLETADWITVDDTGARHRGSNGVCTQIGNDNFAWFGTTGSKSRLNFLDLLRAGYADYTINDAALEYMREHALAGTLVQRLATHKRRQFADKQAWTQHLECLGIAGLAVTPDPVRVATEGALWGAVNAHGFLCEAVVVSDDAGQFNVGQHALCWIHAERLVHKLEAFTDQQRAAQQYVRGLIWWLYADLKAYRLAPTRRRRSELRARFDRIFQRRTGFVTLNRLLQRLHANKDELLMVLDHPEIPLHTNGSENDIRCQVTKRHVSGGTHSDIGRDCRDAFLGLAKTCSKLGIAFWDYLGARLTTPVSTKFEAEPLSGNWQVDNKFACRPCRAATSDTFVPATKLSATIAALRAAEKRRRRPPASPRPTPVVHNKLPSRTMPSIAMPPAIRIGTQLPRTHANFVGATVASVTTDRDR